MNTHAPMTKLWIQNDTKCIFETICASSCKASFFPPVSKENIYFCVSSFLLLLAILFYEQKTASYLSAFFPPSLLFRALISLKMAIYSANIPYFLASFEDNSDI